MAGLRLVQATEQDHHVLRKGENGDLRCDIGVGA